MNDGPTKTSKRTGATADAAEAAVGEAPDSLATPADEAYRLLRRKIISGDYRPSQRLVELRLSQDLGFSRYNIRTALERLQSDGLVEIKPNHGATVTTISLEEALDLLATRAALEVAVTRLAAERITDEDLEVLGDLVSTMRAALDSGDYDTYSGSNVRFHRVIHDASANQSAPELIRLLRSRLARLHLRTILIPGRSVKSLAEHEAIYEALAAHDVDSAGDAAERHVLSLRDAISKAWNIVRL